MRLFFVLLLVLICFRDLEALQNLMKDDVDASIFDYEIPSADGRESPMSALRRSNAKAYLLVNVASQCGYTQSNYHEMRQLKEEFGESLEIIAFPCDDFGHQEPGTNEEIQSFAYGQMKANFPVVGKLGCSGAPGTHPLYEMLVDNMQLPALTWNFFKFITDADGKPIWASPHDISPMHLAPFIRAHLQGAGDL